MKIIASALNFILFLLSVSAVIIAPFLVWQGQYFLAIGSVMLIPGGICNRLVIWRNGGKMPVRTTQPIADHERWCVADKNTQLIWLADIIHTPVGTKSIGDLLIEVGSLFCVYDLIWFFFAR